VAADRFAEIARSDPDNVLVYREWARALDLLGRKDEAASARADAEQAEARLAAPVDVP